MNCDLHTHTVHSDGSYTPRELVLKAKEKDLIVALTDHNTVSGLAEFMEEAEKNGVIAVGGTELSCVYEGREFHLLGLFIPTEAYQEVESLCVEYHRLKEQSNIDLIDKLFKLGYDISYSEIQKRNINGRVNRAHIAAALLEKGYVESVPEAFERLLDEKLGIYLPPKRLELTEAIKFLRKIKAVTVLAHPLKEIDGSALRKMLADIKDVGLVGIETMHSSYTEEQIRLSKELASEFGLIESGGSDFHGSNKPGVELGVGRGNLNISADIYYKMKSKSEE